MGPQTIQRIGPLEPSLIGEASAEIELSVSHLGGRMRSVRLSLARAEQVHDLVTARDEELGDEAAVAPQPRRLGAHDARALLVQHQRESVLPLRRSHPRRVAGERAQTGEALLAGLVRAEPAELDRMAVVDPGLGQRRREGRLVELRIPPRSRVAAHVDEGRHVRLSQARDELRRLTPAVPDREDCARHAA